MQGILLILFGIAALTSAASLIKPRQTSMIGENGPMYQRRLPASRMARDSLWNRNGYGYYTTPYYYNIPPYVEEPYPDFYDFGRPTYYGENVYGYDTYSPYGYGGVVY